MSPVYKHAAPLGLQKKGKRENRADSRLLYTLRSAGAKAGLSRFIVHQSNPTHMSHVAPLGLNAPGDSLVQRVGEPNPYASSFPLGLGLLDMSPVYKHAAPLGLQKKGKRENGADSRLLYTLRSAGARRLDVLLL